MGTLVNSVHFSISPIRSSNPPGQHIIHPVFLQTRMKDEGSKYSDVKRIKVHKRGSSHDVHRAVDNLVA